jgi:hypothetical protein
VSAGEDGYRCAEVGDVILRWAGSGKGKTIEYKERDG